MGCDINVTDSVCVSVCLSHSAHSLYVYLVVLYMWQRGRSAIHFALLSYRSAPLSSLHLAVALAELGANAMAEDNVSAIIKDTLQLLVEYFSK